MRLQFPTLVCLAALSAFSAAPAQAEITVRQAEYRGGVLRIVGETSQPDQKVTLDRRYETRTNDNKQFRFRIRYLPRNCTATLRAGSQVRPAVIANCEPVAIEGVGPQREKLAPTPRAKPKAEQVPN